MTDNKNEFCDKSPEATYTTLKSLCGTDFSPLESLVKNLRVMCSEGLREQVSPPAPYENKTSLDTYSHVDKALGSIYGTNEIDLKKLSDYLSKRVDKELYLNRPSSSNPKK